MNKYNIAMKISAAIFGILFLILIVTQIPTISPFQYAPVPGEPLVTVPVTDLLEPLSNALWGPRMVETLAQVIVLFVAAAGAAALFRLEKRSSIESEANKIEEDQQ
ncbi:MAG: hypothetical protein ACTSQY_01985 [Candidatus Odinarchaeia archaeon]